MKTSENVLVAEGELDEAPAFGSMGREMVKEMVPAYILSNVAKMRKTSQPVDGAPKRDFMPQTDGIDWIKPLEAGLVDVKEPFVDASRVGSEKEEVKESRSDRQLVERWSRLAGLIKDSSR